MVFQKAYDQLRKLYGNIGDFIFVGMIVDPYYYDDEWHNEDYIEFHFHNKVEDSLYTVIIICSKCYATRVRDISNCPCKESTWESLGICDDGYSKVNFDYYVQIGALGGYSEGE